MKVIDGIQKIKAHFPDAVVFRYLEEERNDAMARKLHMVGEFIVNDRKDLVKALDGVGLSVKNAGGGLYIIND